VLISIQEIDDDDDDLKSLDYFYGNQLLLHISNNNIKTQEIPKKSFFQKRGS
jgi:hypothetical protein